MSVKISELTAVTSIAGNEHLPVVQSGVTKKATVNDLLGYKVFSCLIAYDNVGDDMVVQSFRDDFDDLIITKISAGIYNIESSGGQFLNNKTQIFISQDNNNGGGGDGNFIFYNAYRENNSNIRVYANDVDLANGTNTQGDFMTNTSLEIRVYP